MAVVAALAGCGFRHGVAASGDGGDAAVHDGPGTEGDANLTVGRCATPGAIRDNFDDGQVAALWTVDTNGGTVNETGGRLAVTPTASPFSGYISRHYIDLTNAAIEVEVPTMVNTSSNALAELFAELDTNHFVAITQRNGQLTADLGNGGAHTTHSVPYDPVAHRFWRIAEASGMVSFETSPDGLAWTQLEAAPTPPFATTLRIDLGAYVASGSGPYGTVEFDNLDTQVPLADWCKADTLHDNFARTTFGDSWQNRRPGGSGCSEYVSSGAHTDQAGAPTDCYFGSSAAFDLRSSSVVMVITAITNYQAGWITYIDAASDDGSTVRLAFDNNHMCASSGGSPTCRAYVQADSYWRMRESNGTLTFDTSANQTTWNGVLSMPDPFALDAVEMRFGTSSTVDLTATPIGLDFSSYN
jgi:hypothetical protein